jgi:hypothetical protein
VNAAGVSSSNSQISGIAGELHMKNQLRALALIVFGLVALAACDDFNQAGRPGDYGLARDEVRGEVRRVDTRNHEIEIRADSGRQVRLAYDNSTHVFYRQREYDVANLEPGDYIAARAQQDRDGRFYVDRITVRDAAQDRGLSRSDNPARSDRVEGRVERIDNRRGSFEVQDRGRTVVITLPYNPPRSVTDRFNDLRQGDYIRAEGRFVNQDRFEIDRFL